jgi:preprotein translocase subunit SecD
MVLRPVLLTGLLVAALSGCGSEPASTEVSEPPTSPASAESSASPETPPPASGSPVEFRVVLATDLEPAPDSETLQQFDGLDCEAQPVPAPPDEPLPACDDEGVEYVLEPASIVGGVESASAGIPEGQVSWVVTLDLDHEATRTFADVSSELAGTNRQFAIVLDGRVLSAPTVMSPIVDGRLQVSGNFTEESAQALADRLAA